MRKRYVLFVILFFTAFATQVCAQRSAIKRASLSTSVSSAHIIKSGSHKVQQSIGHMGIMSTVRHEMHTATRGFLLPQVSASSYKPLPDLDWVVYPNPFDAHINIDFGLPVSGIMAIRIHDVTGQLILERAVTAKQQQRIHLGYLAQAEYLLTVEVMGKTVSQPLLKNNKHPNRDD